MTIEAEQLRAMLDYCPATGVFTWKVDQNQLAVAGSVAGSIDNDGYRRIRVLGKRHYAHRLAWLYQTGRWPVNMVDHENTDRGDNRWANLREATRSQNMANMRKPPHNSTGYKGVSFEGDRECFRADIRCNGKRYRLGRFATAEQAASAYEKAARDLFGEYARLA